MSTIHPDSLLEQSTTLIEMVRHNSPSGQEAQATSWLVERFRSLGYNQSYLDSAGNGVGEMGDGPREIILLGHIDTVPGVVPFQIQASGEDFLLYGRGSVDAKGPLAAFVDAVARLGERSGWRLVVVGAVDEERDSLGARHLATRPAPDYLIVGEPNRWDRIALGYKGSAQVRVKVHVPLSHSAGESTTAAETAFTAWNHLKTTAETFNQERSRLFDQLLLTLSGFNSGDDGLEAWAELEIGARLPLDLPPQDYFELLGTRLEQLSLPSTSRVSIHPSNFPVSASRVEKNTPLVRAALAAIRKSGGEPGFVLKTGTADLNILAPVWQCPAIVYGPGDSSLDHTPHEHISLREYCRSVVVLTNTLEQLTGQSAR